MIIKRIKIQYRINQALNSAKALKPEISKVAESALKKLNNALNELRKFNQIHPFFSKIIRFIDQRFGFHPLQREIERVQRLIPIVKPVPAPPLEPKTPIGTVEVEIPELPLYFTPVSPKPPVKKDPLFETIQTFHAKYAACFKNDENLKKAFAAYLEKIPLAKRLNSLKEMNRYLEKTEKWIPPESYLIHILNSPESVQNLMHFLEEVFEKRALLSHEQLEEKMKLYIDDVFTFGLYWIPGMEALLSKEKVEAFLLDPKYEDESNRDYIQSMIEELEGSNHPLLELLHAILKKIDLQEANDH